MWCYRYGEIKMNIEGQLHQWNTKIHNLFWSITRKHEHWKNTGRNMSVWNVITDKNSWFVKKRQNVHIKEKLLRKLSFPQKRNYFCLTFGHVTRANYECYSHLSFMDMSTGPDSKNPIKRRLDTIRHDCTVLCLSLPAAKIFLSTIEVSRSLLNAIC